MKSKGEIVLEIRAIDEELNELAEREISWYARSEVVAHAYADMRGHLGRLKENLLTELGHAYFTETAP
jgi:hypothetical protein